MKEKTKKEKKIKMLSGKKLPKMFKKAYSEKTLEKKIYKKIYIKTDLEFIKQIFEKTQNKKGAEIWKADIAKTYPKTDIVRYKKLAKQIKVNKGTIKLVPFAAVAVLLAGIGISVTLFKNIIVKSAISSGMEAIFGVKPSINKVDLQIFGASLEIDGFAQPASADSEKNIFEIDQVKVNFNLTDLLKGKFHAEDLSVSGVALDTERKVTVKAVEKENAVKVKPAAENQKKEAETAEKKESKKAKAPKTDSKSAKKSEKKNKIVNNASDQLQKMFESYNPENLLKSVQDELKSPELAEKVTGEVQSKVEKWQSVPTEYEKSVTTLIENGNAIANTDWSKMYDIQKINETVNLISSTLKEADALKTKIEKTTADIKEDSQLISSYSTQIQDAIKSDMKIVDTKVNEMKGLFSAAGLQGIMSDAITSVLYSVLGKYEPYAEKAFSIAKATATGKSSKSAKEEKKAKKTRKRAAGRTIYYKKDVVPKLLIEKAEGSGYEYNTDKLLFKATATEISSDQDMRGKPASINADFNIAGAKNNAKVVIDSRSASTAPLITADYKGNGYPISADVEIFELESTSNIVAALNATKDGKFTVTGTLDLASLKMEGMSFEPEVVSRIYKNSLLGIKKLNLGFTAEYSKEDGLKINLLNAAQLGKQLSEPVIEALNKELNSIIEDAKQQVAKLISDKTGIATDKITEFTDIEKLLKNYSSEVSDMQGTLKKMQKDLSNQAKNAAKAAADEAAAELKRQAEEAAKKAADEAKAAAEEAAKDAVKGLFKGFGF